MMNSVFLICKVLRNCLLERPPGSNAVLVLNIHSLGDNLREWLGPRVTASQQQGLESNECLGIDSKPVSL